MTNYYIFRKDRDINQHGGIIIEVRKDHVCDLNKIIINENSISVHVEVNVKSRIDILAIYNPPTGSLYRSSVANICNIIGTHTKLAATSNSRNIIIGDFNHPHINWISNTSIVNVLFSLNSWIN